MPDRPVRLTFPSNDIGYARIMAGDLQVGNARRGYRGWTAWLWSRADDRHGGWAGVIPGKRLRDIREESTRWLENKGPWWTG